MSNVGHPTAKIIQIVPHLPPQTDGVGDYAAKLAEQLWQDCGVETIFLVGDPVWQRGDWDSSFAVQPIAKRSASELIAFLQEHQPAANQPISVLLHYSNYGYAKRGCPVWLVAGLERWQAKTAHSHLVTMFHELYASGRSVWTSSFWLSSLQKNLAMRLAKLSDRSLTSKQEFAHRLYQLSSGKSTTALPVFSSIGEPSVVSSLRERPPKLVVFGQPANRLRVYQKSLAALQQVCQALAIEEIYDVGPPVQLSQLQVGNIPITCLGKQPATQVSQILLNSRAGFFDYFSSSLAKSTIFAAYCAHGLLPVGTFDHPPPPKADGLMPGQQYWLASDTGSTLNWMMGQAIADRAYAWYQDHTLTVHAKVFAAQLLENQVPERN